MNNDLDNIRRELAQQNAEINALRMELETKQKLERSFDELNRAHVQLKIRESKLAESLEEVNRALTEARLAAATADQANQQQVAELEHLYRSAPVGLELLDRNFRVLRVNERLAILNGKSVQDHIGRTLREIVPQFAPEIEAVVDQVFATGQPILNIEVHGVTPADPTTERDWLVSYSPVKSTDGVPRYVGCVVLEITERKKVENELRRQKDLLQTVIDHIPCAVFWKDRHSVNLGGNQLAATDLGFASPAEMIGKNNFDLLVTPAEAESYTRFDREVMEKGTPLLNIEEILTKPDGSRLEVLTSKVPLRGPTGDVFGVLAIYLDISSRKRVEEDLRQAKAAAEAASLSKSQFLANMSHEIRTPLTAILGYADLLREDEGSSPAPEDRQRSIDTILSAGQHLLSVINNILDLSKIEANKMILQPVETPLVGILAEVESFLRPKAASKGVALTVRLETPVPERVISEPTYLRQIITNLAANAVKFTEVGSVIIGVRVVANGQGSRLQIDVEDTGPGMTPAQAALIFNPFMQADTGMTRKFGGTGLGLTISRGLALIMSGNVTLERTEPGKGSMFRLDLPLNCVTGTAMTGTIDNHALRSTAPPRSTAIRLQGRILLVEDGPDNQRLISFHLRKAGALVDVAENGKVALEMLDKAAASGSSYALLVSDMQMPEMDGYALAKTLRHRGSTLPIIALTAHAMAEDRDRCLAAGCDDYATKPIDKSALLATCALWIGQRGGKSSRVIVA